ncbi:MAG: replication-relaxation family protein [Patescibacteria group bacterium]
MKNIRITYNQIEILDIVNSFRYLPLKVLVKIAKKEKLYAFRQNISRIVNRLEQRGFIKCFYYGNNWKVIYLTKLGVDILASARGVNPKEFGIPNNGVKVQFAMLEHTVKIAELYEQFLCELASYPEFNLLEWHGDQKALYHYSFKSTRTGKTIKRNFSPDSYFKMQKDEAVLGYFLEYDTGNMDKEQLTRKFMRYFEYFVYGDWSKRFTVFPSILFLTNRSDEQINNLLEKDEVELNKALKDRPHLAKSKHVILKGIGISDNLKSISSDKIREFLRIEIIFAHINEKWSKQLLNKLALS